MCHPCEQLGYRWAVCSACGVEFAYQAADQLAALEAGRMESAGGWPWYVEGHVPDWLIPAMVWQRRTEPDHCFHCDPNDCHAVES